MRENVSIQVFLISAVVEGEWSASRPGFFTHRGRAPLCHWIGGWVYPRLVITRHGVISSDNVSILISRGNVHHQVAQ
jgi:hypothetical protein